MPPTPVATPRPPWKRRKTDFQAPRTAATPASAWIATGAPATPREEDGHGALGQVEQAHRSARGPAHGAQRIGAAGPTRPHGPRVGAAGESRDDDAHRQRADEVAQPPAARSSAAGRPRAPEYRRGTRAAFATIGRSQSHPSTHQRESQRAQRAQRSPALRPRRPRSRDRWLLGRIPSRAAGPAGGARRRSPEGIGGTCLHVGCIPTKAMLESADLYDRIRHAADMGIKVGEASVDAEAIAARRDQVVTRLAQGPAAASSRRTGVDYIRGRGRLEGPQKVRVAPARRRAAAEPARPCSRRRDVILATGSRVKSLPGLEPDGERIVTSDDVLRSASVPASRSSSWAAARWASSSPATTTTWAARSRCSSTCPPSCRSRMPRSPRRWSAPSRSRGIKVMTKARFDPASVPADDCRASA